MAGQNATKDVLDSERLGFLRLNDRARAALGYAVKVLAEEHELNNGTTALYWHLAHTAESHVRLDTTPEDGGT